MLKLRLLKVHRQRQHKARQSTGGARRRLQMPGPAGQRGSAWAELPPWPQAAGVRLAACLVLGSATKNRKRQQKKGGGKGKTP